MRLWSRSERVSDDGQLRRILIEACTKLVTKFPARVWCNPLEGCCSGNGIQRLPPARLGPILRKARPIHPSPGGASITFENTSAHRGLQCRSCGHGTKPTPLKPRSERLQGRGGSLSLLTGRARRFRRSDPGLGWPPVGAVHFARPCLEARVADCIWENSVLR